MVAPVFEARSEAVPLLMMETEPARELKIDCTAVPLVVNVVIVDAGFVTTTELPLVPPRLNALNGAVSVKLRW